MEFTPGRGQLELSRMRQKQPSAGGVIDKNHVERKFVNALCAGVESAWGLTPDEPI